VDFNSKTQKLQGCEQKTPTTHLREDFAEAYRLYMMNEEGFLALIKDNPERQKKYDFLKEYVFN